MKKNTLLVAVLILGLTGLMFSTAEAQKPEYDRKGIEVGTFEDVTFSIGLSSVGRVQVLGQNDVFVWNGSEFVKANGSLDGMQTSFANLEFMFSIGGEIDVFMDGLLATQRHPSQWWGNQGYMYIRSIPGNSFLTVLNPLLQHIDIKAGNFFVDFGEHQYTRTINADAHRNPLVGNPVVSPIGAEPGMEIIHNGNGYGLMVGAGIGAPEQDFGGNRKYSFRTKAWVDAIDGLYLSGSYYTVNHDEGVLRGTNLFRRERHGSSYGGVWNLNNDNSGSGEGPGSVRPGIGQELSAWEVNAIFNMFEGNKISGYFGQGQSIGPDQRNAEAPDRGDEEWNYYSAEIQQFVNDNFYLAARYSNVDYTKFVTTDNDGNVYRLQGGFGSFITRNILLKAEYVYQAASGFNANTTGVANAVDVGRDPSFNGLVLEVAVTF